MRLLAYAALAALSTFVIFTSRVNSSSQTVHPPYTAEAERDRVHKLPGARKLDFDLFSGYVTVDDKAGRSLFYALAESPEDSLDKPLVLWFNGGPGCSSLGGGFMSELGPYYPTPTGEHLVRNDYSWNHVSNVLFLESPAFVGFSYSNSSEDATVGDERTAKDAYEFLVRFLERFDHYKGRQVWLSGESYGGHYIPQLALEIVKHNKLANKEEDKINFQGFLVGNALTVPEVDSRGALQFWYTHGIISKEAFEGVGDCDFAAIDPLMADNRLPEYVSAQEGNTAMAADHSSVLTASRRLQMESIPLSGSKKEEKCQDFIEQAMEEMGGINIYDIYAPVCLPEAQARTRQMALMLKDHPAGLSMRPSLYQPRYDPCIDNEVEIYFNRPDVQKALHANVTGDLPGPWTTCTPRISYSRDDLLSSMIPTYEELLDSGIKMLVYTGDVDAIVPIIGTRQWIESLGLEVEEKWRPWRSSTGQVGGWTVGYEKGLHFASVRGAGHMVPYTQPERAFYMFTQWINGKPL